MTLLIRHSLLLMFLCAILGFLFPSASMALFPFLPFVLFSLMTLTLLGIDQVKLMERLSRLNIWLYTAFHSLVLMLLVGVIGWLLGFSIELGLASVAIAATGSLFATPAIVRALDFDVMQAMAMTIATTLSLPIVIVLTLLVYQTEAIELDWVGYCYRLMIFIFGPMLFSYCIHKAVPKVVLNRFLSKITPYTIFLVFAFPFGLIGGYRTLFDQAPWIAFNYFLIATGLCFLFFGLSYCVYRRKGAAFAITAAITSGNRNVLLTYTIAGSLLGPAFLPLAGAIQLPTYLLPVISRWMSNRAKKQEE
ncbi:hypothetical protein OFY17_12605 [Marinomonas sp. C2222]|uniref:Sodium Bile acid symporter family protein n=1 Tax=Marinomonas sargassi TaxID=2984494 RepID=A0ABT2YV23_9GAMM|nr:hypothetical protein [Marinomonas sargassi]MCV2403713.1 hypothetical protein [Marinomonas sargassi]